MVRRILSAVLLVALASAAAAVHAGHGLFKRGMYQGRMYRLYIPSSVVETPLGATPRPLVIALHGCWQTPEDFAVGTRLNDVAERRGLFVLYPAQGRGDNVSRCWNWFLPEHQSRTHGEVAGILALVREVQREYRIAGDRIIALGFSAGGYMAVNLVCAAPDVVTGVGVAAGGPYRCGIGVVGGINCMRGLRLDAESSAAACRSAMEPRARTIRASLWHGADDVVVNPSNLTALVTMFARLAGAAAPVPDRRPSTAAVVSRDGKGRPVIEAWLIEGMGHAWSGGDPRGTHTYPAGPQATDKMLQFLLPDD